MCMEMIIERYKVNNIHEIWPNLRLFVHGGVSFEPYRHGFEKLLGKPLIYIETYLASEGFIAYRDKQNAHGMKLVTNEHIFHEFVPFDDKTLMPMETLYQTRKHWCCMKWKKERIMHYCWVPAPVPGVISLAIRFDS